MLSCWNSIIYVYAILTGTHMLKMGGVNDVCVSRISDNTSFLFPLFMLAYFQSLLFTLRQYLPFNNYLAENIVIHSEQELADYTTVIFHFYLFLIRQSVLWTHDITGQQNSGSVHCHRMLQRRNSTLFTVTADNEVRRFLIGLFFSHAWNAPFLFSIDFHSHTRAYANVV